MVGAADGRVEPGPALLKPSPHLLALAMETLGATPATCTLIGDSTSYIHSAHAASLCSIGYANKPGKRDRLAGAGAVIATMADLAAQLTTPPG